MPKVIFTIQYEINKDKRDEYYSVIKELKNLVTGEGLESYRIFEVKGKPNHFQEIYIFASNEAYEQFDDDQSERINILINKLNDLTVGNSVKYTTMHEILQE